MHGIYNLPLVSSLKLLGIRGNFHLNTEYLDKNWEALKEQINTLIDGNSELQTLIANLRKEKVRGSTAGLNGKAAGNEKIIDLQDFLDPK